MIPCELDIFCVLTTVESRANIWYKKNAFKPPLVSAAVRSNVVAVLLCDLLLLPLLVRVLCLLFSTLCPSSFAIILMGKRESQLLYFNSLSGVL